MRVPGRISEVIALRTMVSSYCVRQVSHMKAPHVLVITGEFFFLQRGCDTIFERRVALDSISRRGQKSCRYSIPRI